MNSWLPIALAASVLLTSCSSIRDTPSTHPTVPAIPSVTAGPLAAATPVGLPQTLRKVALSTSLSLVVDDPGRALARLEGAILEAGGSILSASSWSSPGSPSYSNLSARVPAASLSNLRQVTLELALQVQSDSTYGQDMTFELRQLERRLQTISNAEGDLWQFVTESDDPQRGASYSLFRDLLERERADVERQLADASDRVALASFDAVFNRTSAMMLIE